MKYQKVIELPIENKELNKKGFIITSNHVNESTHIFHKYPAKFIPHIPRWGIKYLKENPILIIDPFCGSGTTNLEAYRLGNYSIGFDIDPLAILISKVKTNLISHNDLEKAKILFNKQIKKYNHKKKYSAPAIENLNHWFTDDAINKLAYINEIISKYFNGDIKNFLLITYSSIIREVSNADNQTQKTYVSHTLKKSPPEVFDTFNKKLYIYSECLTNLQKEVNNSKKFKPFYVKADSRKDLSLYLKKYEKKITRVIITSPPYGKAIDYIYNQMLEYFWLGDVLGPQGKKQLNEYKRNYIGTKQIYSNEYNNFAYKSFQVPKLDKLIKLILKKDKKHAYITYQYFYSMKENLINSLKLLRKGEHYIMVVGITNVSGHKVDTRELLSQLAKKVGYEIETSFFYKIRNRYMRFNRNGKGGLIEDDHVVIFTRM